MHHMHEMLTQYARNRSGRTWIYRIACACIALRRSSMHCTLEHGSGWARQQRSGSLHNKAWLVPTYGCPRTLMLRTVFLTNTVAVLLNSSPTDLRAIPLKSRCLRISMCGFPCSTAFMNSAVVNTYVIVDVAACSTCLPQTRVTCKVPCC
jgi:hypothetical protein